MAWPFSRVKPLGFALFEMLTSTHLNALDSNAAAAASGDIWSDYAVFKNWTRTSALTNRGVAVTYDPANKLWGSFGQNAGVPEVSHTTTGTEWINNGTINGGAGTNLTVTCSATAPNGHIVVGGSASSASTQKIRTSDGAFSVWTPRSIGASNTQAVTSVAFSSALNLWVAGVATEGIFTSADRATWTSRTLVIDPRFLIVRETPTPLIIAYDPGILNSNYFTSPDGIAWTSQNFPVAPASCFQGIWSDYWGAFYVPTALGLYKSTTGLTGSWTVVDAGFTTGGIAAFGRVIARSDGRLSLTGAAPFTRFYDASGPFQIRASAAGCVLVSSTDHRVSVQVGA